VGLKANPIGGEFVDHNFDGFRVASVYSLDLLWSRLDAVPKALDKRCRD
jgi:hypothetical protein